MKFSLPHQQIEFEIPNERWVAAGMNGCKPIAVSYTATSDPRYPKTIVPISEVEAPVRNKGGRLVTKGAYGSDSQRISHWRCLAAD